MSLSSHRIRYLRYACMLMVAAAGLRAATAWIFKVENFSATPHWVALCAGGFSLFVAAYALTPQDGGSRGQKIALLSVQSLAALCLVWLYPNFIITCLLVVVAWQIAWFTSFRIALAVTVLQSVILAVIRCANQPDATAVIVLLSTCGFQMFAVCAAHLARSEAAARDGLALANDELQATHSLLNESALMAERLRISRDLHDILGHRLTTLTIQLDVASRLASAPAAEHVDCARGIAAAMLQEVRDVVSQVRVAPLDLRKALQALTQELGSLSVRLILPEDLSALDPARADAIMRCVQELVTNALRHSEAKELIIELEQSPDGAVIVTARDDGKGGPFCEGRGLSGMRERFERLGGSLTIGSQRNSGFEVRGAMPAGKLCPT